MNIITTFQNFFYQSAEDYHFNVPDYCKLLDINLTNSASEYDNTFTNTNLPITTNTIEILIQQEEKETDYNKSIMVKVLNFANGYRSDDYKFLKTVQVAYTKLISQNGSINAVTNSKLYYIFYKEMPSPAELRSTKINEIVDY